MPCNRVRNNVMFRVRVRIKASLSVRIRFRSRVGARDRV